MSKPTALSDPIAYLASEKFSRTMRCKRTSKRVSYADIGDPDGTPLLFLLPSGCSRWFAAPQDPLARRYRIRLIAVDRPGVGATEMVPLQERIRLSCEMITSVLEHLNVRPQHILVHSAGIYYALNLLVNFSSYFTPSNSCGLPYLYLIAPWSPILPMGHPDYYHSHLAWIPSKLIETQHLTLPTLLTLAERATSAWNLASSAWKTGLSYAASTLFSTDVDDPPNTRYPTDTGEKNHLNMATPDKPSLEPSSGKGEMDEDGINGEFQEEDGRLWGDFPCCVGCTTTEYVHAENYQGVGQGEHLVCLKHGPDNTGHEWIESRLAEIAEGVKKRRSGDQADRLEVAIWWGLQDGMVPRKGQSPKSPSFEAPLTPVWLNKTFQSYPNEINVAIHEVSDADHADLMGRIDGIHRVYGMIWERSDGR